MILPIQMFVSLTVYQTCLQLFFFRLLLVIFFFSKYLFKFIK
jgi:hypothetical protein